MEGKEEGDVGKAEGAIEIGERGGSGEVALEEREGGCPEGGTGARAFPVHTERR